jgi:hypothetical protein
MAYVFQDIVIYAFDVHTTVAPFTNDKCFVESLSFLSDPEQYRQQSAVGKVVETDSFTIKPLTPDEIEHHFWAAYSNSWRNGEVPDYWRLQLPFRCEVKAQTLALDAGHPALKVFIKPEIFLTAIGWSTNLYIRIKGALNTQQLQSLVARLFQSQAKPFLIAGEAQTLTGVFGHFKDKMKKEVYAQKKPDVDKLTLEKNYVLSPVTFTGQTRYYCPPRKADHPEPAWTYDLNSGERMSQLECASMLGILYGSAPTIGEWSERSYKTFSHGKMRGPSFSLTDLKVGTFLFMQENAVADGTSKSKKALWCYTSNVRLCSMMIPLLVKFHKHSSREASRNPKIAELREAIAVTLKELPDNCLNAVCRRIHRANSEVREIIAPHSDAAAAADKDTAAEDDG